MLALGDSDCPVRPPTKDHRVLWYPSGWVGVGARTPKRCGNAVKAQAFAEAKLEELLVVRATSGRPTLDQPHPDAIVDDALAMWIESLADGSKGTRKKYNSVAQHWISQIGGNLCADVDLELFSEPLRQAVKSRVKVNTFNGIDTALRSFRGWARAKGWLAAWQLADDAALTRAFGKLKSDLAKRLADDESATIGAWGDGVGDDGRIGIADVGDWSTWCAMADAMARAKTDRHPWRPTSGRGSTGGPKPLSEREAWRLGESIKLKAATGLRTCELLGLHSSDVSRKTGFIKVRRQLDRYERWEAGQPPPTTAPKYGQPRTAQCFGFYLPNLIELCDYADEFHDGWLVAPTAGQAWWAEAWEDAFELGVRLYTFERDQALASGLAATEVGPEWRWTPHDARHFWASWALAPLDVGGYDIPVTLASERLGHSSTKVTTDTYQHRVGNDDDLLLNRSTTAPPGWK
jgi:integrase